MILCMKLSVCIDLISVFYEIISGGPSSRERDKPSQSPGERPSSLTRDRRQNLLKELIGGF